jgi:signal transduction histidine kinase/ligand-binding sensor domain-containing protein
VKFFRYHLVDVVLSALHRGLVIPDRRSLVLLVLSLLAAAPVEALDATRTLAQHGHTAWRVKDGFFNGAPNTAAQTKDGYLWIGTESGLLQFDGVRFSPLAATVGKLPSSAVISLLAARDGGLLIGTASGLARLQGNHLETVGADPARINEIVEDRDGKVWVARSRIRSGPLCSVEGLDLRCYGRPDGLGFDHATALTADSLGRVWVGSGSKLSQFQPGASTTFSPPGMETPDALLGIGATAAAPDGTIWAGFASAAPGQELQQFRNGQWVPFALPSPGGDRPRIVSMMFDRGQALWIGTVAQGIYRIAAGKIEHFSTADGLSGDNIGDFFEDREGSIWVLTTQGLDRFRNLAVANFLKRDGRTQDYVGSVLAGRNGTVWVSGPNGLESLREGRWTSIKKSDGLPGRVVTSLFQDQSDRLWVGVDGGLFLYEKSRFVPIRKADGSPVGTVTGLAQGPGTTVVAAVIGKPNRLISIREDHVAEDVAVLDRPTRLTSAPDGWVWLSSSKGFMRYRNGTLEIGAEYPADLLKNAASIKISDLLALPDGTKFFATSAGLFAMRGEAARMPSRVTLPCSDIYAAIQDASDGLWLYTECGLLGVSANEMKRWWKSPGTLVEVRQLGASDGVLPTSTSFQPPAARDPQGRLWFASATGLQMVDPTRLARNEIPPPVHIETVTADRVVYAPSDGLRLPVRTNDLEIDYTALSLVLPERVRFRYRLEGHDTAWQEPGGRRQAFYNGLSPGNYRFRVVASNNDGVWNEEGATLSFSIPAAWYQTAWFKLLCAVLAAGLAWSIYRVRVNQIGKAISARFEERMAERMRIGRELHDTMLQGFQGLIISLEGIRKRSSDATTQRDLGDALDRADVMVAEGRDRIHDLRPPGNSPEALPTALAQVIEQLQAVGNDARFKFRVIGAPVPLQPAVGDQLLLICREALWNAQRHAAAHNIELVVRYDARALSLHVADDGRGLPTTQTEREDSSPHFGIASMRERAQLIGARFDIGTAAGGGTVVHLNMSGRCAYAISRPKWWHRQEATPDPPQAQAGGTPLDRDDSESARKANP